MDRETFKNTIQEIGTCEDDSQRRIMLANLQDEVLKNYDANDTDKTTIDTLNKTLEDRDKRITDLESANLDLFKRIGIDVSEQEKLKKSTGLEEPEENRRRFENLFDEKGGLKL